MRPRLRERGPSFSYVTVPFTWKPPSSSHADSAARGFACRFARVLRKYWSDTMTVSSSTACFMLTGTTLGTPSGEQVENAAA